MRMKNLNRIRELCEWQRQSFEKTFLLARSYQKLF